MSRRNRRDVALTASVFAFITAGIGGTAYMQRQHDAKIEAIMAGDVRGNKASRIFHVPTCPEYDSINVNNIRTFSSVAEAEEANYRPSRNCLEAVETRNLNETETSDGPDGNGYDDPRY